MTFDEYWEQYKLRKINSTYTLMDVAEAAWQAATSSKRDAVTSSNLDTVTSSKSFDEWFNTVRTHDLGEIAEQAWAASRAAVIAEVSAGLPELKNNKLDIRNTFHEGKICGFNQCLDAIKEKLEKLK